MSILNLPRLRPVLLPLLAASALSIVAGCSRDPAPPTAVEGAPAQAEAKTAARIYVCPMHPHITSHEPGTCPICGMNLVLKKSEATKPSDEAEAEPVVVVPSAVRQTLGIRTAHVMRRDVRPRLQVPARVVAEVGGELRLQSRVDGFVERLHVAAVGTRINAGTVIAEIFAPELVQAQEEMLLGGDAAAAAAERLRRFGIDARDIESVRRAAVSSRTLPLRTPAGGVVVSIDTREGARIGAEDALATIATRGGLRVEAQLFPAQRQSLGAGIDADFSQPGVPGLHWQGRDPQWLNVVDPVTQTLGLRFRIDAAEALALGTALDAELFGAARTQVLLVPAAAVIRTEAGTRVLREDDAGSYMPVAVRIGMRYGSDIEIVDGLAEHDRIVVSGQFLIDSEAQLQAALARLRAGTGGHDHD
jgi:Cu(I)/Ag(I) efflux system membrane fusion protein